VAWLAAASGALARVATALGDPEGAAVHSERAESLLQALDDVHWDEQDGAYYDVGMHSERGAFRDLAVIRCASARDQNDGVDEAVAPELLQQGARDLCPSHHPRFLWPIGDGAGNILTRPTYIESDADKSIQFVRRVGVVNIFPMLLRLLPEDSPRLPRMLDLLADKNKLWSKHGMRSLGKEDMCVVLPFWKPHPSTITCLLTMLRCTRCACLPACMSCGVVLGRFYQRENAPGDAPYWRGYVWAPINYLALQSLHHYAHSSLTPPATAQRAQEMYSELRTNLLDTILGSYHQTGFYWEQYATYF
jgi:mannosyl-oligosaccharide glucosidase